MVVVFDGVHTQCTNQKAQESEIIVELAALPGCFPTCTSANSQRARTLGGARTLMMSSFYRALRLSIPSGFMAGQELLCFMPSSLLATPGLHVGRGPM